MSQELEVTYLLTSQQDYIVANDGDWIEITEAEYNNLATNLNNVSTAGLSDGVFESNPGSLDSNGGSGYTMCTQNTSDTNLRIKEDNYVFAFKYVSMVATTRTTDRVKISSSTTITDTFTDLGSTLASHSGIGVHYFVIKGNNTKNSGDGYLAIYSSNSTGKKTMAGYSNYYRSGNHSSMNAQETTSIYQYQALTTTEKQW
jgi:hypothetical protein